MTPPDCGHDECLFDYLHEAYREYLRNPDPEHRNLYLEASFAVFEGHDERH